MDQKKCVAINRAGKPCARIPAPGSLKCYKHADGSEFLTDEEVDALIGWYEDLQLLSGIEHPSPDDRRMCEALWILVHAYEVLARQRAGLRSQCPTPCGLCGGLDDVLNYREPVVVGTIDQKPTTNVSDDEPEDPADTSVEVL